MPPWRAPPAPRRPAPPPAAPPPAALKLTCPPVGPAPRHGKWVGVCGGMAAEPLAVPVLLGIGVDELSVPGPAIAAIKALVRRLSLRRCQDLAREVASLSTAGEVRARLAAVHRGGGPAGGGGAALGGAGGGG